MNTQIVRVFIFILVLFSGLVYFTSRWSVLEADDLKANIENRRPLIEEQQIKRGKITSADGVLLAESVSAGGGPQRVYVRRYPQGQLFSNPVGYSFVDVGRTGIELAENELLTGDENEFASLIDELLNKTREGADIQLTLDAGAQQVALDALESALASVPGTTGAGSVVAIEPATGAIKVMASVPGFDPNAVQDEEVFSDLAQQGTGAGLFNRALQGTFEPGSTMKVVTAVAALDSGEFEPTTTLSADSGIDISGAPLANSGGADFGTIDMTTALTNSVNTYWAQVGEKLGANTYLEYMDRFGFNADPELNFADEEMKASGIYQDGSLLTAADLIDVGRVAIGQERLLATPTQMAQVAAAVANGGELMKPTFLLSATDQDGREVEQLDPDKQASVMSAETASTVAQMMVNVANEGTAAGLSTSLGQLAGKTGTAEIDVATSVNRPWFIGFAPAEDPQIVVAAMLERCTGCSGGAVAGPIATQVMDALAG